MSDFKILPNGRTVDEFCQKCGLWKMCESPRMEGEGSESPTWLFVAEAPGETEDIKGIPLCGDSGYELRKAIEEIGIPIEKCRFTNVVRCRPPQNNLKAYPKAVDYCRAHILREIHSLKPKVVVLFGNTAAKSIFNQSGIMKLHGTVQEANGIKFVFCFHPAYYLRNKTAETRGRMLEALRVAHQMGNPKRMAKALKGISIETIRDKKMLYEFTDLLKKEKMKAADIESSTLSPYATKRPPRTGVVGFAWDKNHAVVYPIHSRVNVNIQVSVGLMLEAVREIWEDENAKFIMHFGKHDYCYMAVRHNMWMNGFMKRRTGYSYDTGMMSYAYNENKGVHGLEKWVWKLGLGGCYIEVDEFWRTHPQCHNSYGGDINLTPGEYLYPYNGTDCIATFRLYHHLRPKLEELNLWKNPFLFPLMYHNWTASMLEIVGIKTDLGRNRELQVEFPETIDQLEKDLFGFAEVRKLERFKLRKLVAKAVERVESYKRPVENPRKRVKEIVAKEIEKKPLVTFTPEDKRKLIYGILKMPVLGLTESGMPSISKKVLVKLENRQNPVLQKLLERNQYYFGYSKYVKPIPSWVGSDERTHTTYRVHGQFTGRVSSADPNHENLPKRYKLAEVLRSQWIPTDEDFVLLAGDEKQMELRLIADRAQDDKMIAEFEANLDPHMMGAQAAFEITPAQWEKMSHDEQKEKRTASKSAVSFGLVYGRGAEALARDFGQPVGWAEEFKGRYFGKYDDIPGYWHAQEKFANKHGCVYSFFGRRRKLPGIRSEERGIYNKAVRVAVNSPIQGDASDVTWTAGWRMWNFLMKYRMKSKVHYKRRLEMIHSASRPVVIIHDDLTLDAHIKELADVIERMQFFMTDRKFIKKLTGWYCSVPFDIDLSIGHKHFGKMVELERKGDEFIIPSALR
jgi:uracil-DNA glycosylase family 4